MMRTLMLLCALLLAPLPAAAQSVYDLKAQLDLLKTWLPGDYDNNEQIVRQSGGGLSPTVNGPVRRLHLLIRPISAPQFGEHVFYLEEYQNNDPTQVTRIRLYSLQIDEAKRALRLLVINPKDQKTLIGRHGDLTPIERLAAKDVNVDPPECVVWVRWIGGQFQGDMTPRACKAGNAWIDYDLVFGSTYHWLRSKRRSLKADAVLSTNPTDDLWVQQTKARWFMCTVHHNAQGEMLKTEDLTSVRLHDQGGEADIAWPDGRTLTFVIHTRAFTAPPNLEYPLFRIHEKGNLIPIAYAWASEGADHFGLNLGWYYTRCYLEGHEPAQPIVSRK